MLPTMLSISSIFLFSKSSLFKLIFKGGSLTDSGASP